MKLTNIIKTFQVYRNPLVFYAMYLGLVKKDSLLKLSNGLKIYTRPQKLHHFTINEVFFEEEYHPALKHLKSQPSLVIDIGAHIGAFTLLASLYAKKVIAYEPEKASLRVLRKNLKLNHLKNILVRPVGIAAKAGHYPIYYSPTNQQASLYQSGFIKSQDKIKCVTLTQEIDKLKLAKIDLLKLDCEGAEFEILLNLPQKYFKIVDVIILEYHDFISNKYHHKDLIKLLKTKGFKVKTLRNIKTTTGIIIATKS